MNSGIAPNEITDSVADLLCGDIEASRTDNHTELLGRLESLDDHLNLRLINQHYLLYRNQKLCQPVLLFYNMQTPPLSAGQSLLSLLLETPKSAPLNALRSAVQALTASQKHTPNQLTKLIGFGLTSQKSLSNFFIRSHLVHFAVQSINTIYYTDNFDRSKNFFIVVFLQHLLETALPMSQTVPEAKSDCLGGC